MSLADPAFEPLASVEVIDSHTEGEPTRVVIGGWPPPKGRTMTERRAYMQARQDHLRRGVVTEPRGHDAIVGALLTPAESPESDAGVVFFNDVGYLGMCGHGLMGVARTLLFQHPEKRDHWEQRGMRIDTPAGTVRARLEVDNDAVEIQNVPSSLYAADIEVDVEGIGRVRGDVAYGGNWFFLMDSPGIPLRLENKAQLLRVTEQIRSALASLGVTGAEGAPIDHIELFGRPTRNDADSRNFVLCPGAAYDRSPCGTGTSAKMAAMHAKGKLVVGEPYRQESITGSLFVGHLDHSEGGLVPVIRGEAHVIARSTLIFHPNDPFRFGFPE
ncbi:MAG: proline racemase family protein [Fimbriimonadaceae bacterium]|nr:proline racemase family protein [Fimbriimonadaceae bacterium]